MDIFTRALPRNRLSRRGFTLIELLIVIAIILILIAIALPNFLEAQVRARITKAKGEIRSLGIAMESYFLDFQVYPAESEHDIMSNPSRGRFQSGLFWLTSPIAYITSIPLDPFPGEATEVITYETGGVEYPLSASPKQRSATALYCIFSRGPDAPGEDVNSADPHIGIPGDGSVDSYNPTNGSKSNGDIFQYGGDSLYMGVQVGNADLGAARLAPAPGLPVDGTLYIRRLPPPLR